MAYHAYGHDDACGGSGDDHGHDDVHLHGDDDGDDHDGGHDDAHDGGDGGNALCERGLPQHSKHFESHFSFPPGFSSQIEKALTMNLY